MDKGYDAETIIAAMIKKLVKFDLSEERDLNDVIIERRKRGAVKLENTERFHVNLGKKQGIRPGDILGAVAGECDIPGSDIGEIELLDNFSFFTASKEHKNRILDRMNRSQIKGMDVIVELSKEKKSRFNRDKSSDDKSFWKRKKRK